MNEKPKGTWHKTKCFFLGLACLAVLIALFYAEEDRRGWHAWQKFKHKWEAKGERFDLASVIPPAVPDDQNFALTPIVFTSYGKLLTRDGKEIPFKDRDTNFVNRMEMPIGHNNDDLSKGLGSREQNRASNLKFLQEYYRALAAKTNQFRALPEPQMPADDVLLALSKYDPAIEELRQASQLPCSRYPLNYCDSNNPPAAIMLPHLAPLKACASVLRLRSTAELQNGQSEKALADVKLALQLTGKIQTEPFLISHLVRIAMVNITLQSIWGGLAQHKWSDAQLTGLDSALAQLDFLADYEFAMRGERALDMGNIEFFRKLHKRPFQTIREFPDFSGDDFQKHKFQMFALAFGPSGWFYQNELQFGRFYAKWCLPAVNDQSKTVSPTAARATDAALEREARHQTPENVLAAMLLPAITPAVRKFAYAQESVDLARVACALERYRLAHGVYPESLDVLAPQFIDKLPHDVINGQPLQYHPEANGQFVLYSVGWNETDDDGEVGLTKNNNVDTSTGDWVWQYPAK
jgi:type II secretory pathway pseudopilin PulG